MAPYDIDWEGLKKFISEKEGYERNFGTAAPLTNAQRAAIHTLVPPPQASPEEATDDINWVSTLLHYLQVHHLTSDIKFTDEPVHLPNPVGKGTDLKWRCFTELPNGEAAAPSPTAAPSTQTEATRPTKRQGFQDGDVPRQNMPPTSVIPGLSMAPFSGDAIQPRSLFQADSNPPPSILTPGDSVRRSEPRPVAGQVAELARVLKLPQPRYDCIADVGSRNTWSVTADFGGHHLPPVGLGAFSGVFTKQAAKERSAEAVLEWMIGVKEDREQIANDFLEGGLL
ncbi:predicted protein [Verticillium alfalfae VaMs.102]|uniref:Predicted protein n=1 Tax=Verticillium alfalfae (strain VaMs.102 / ATCC MYA-4576 / FGSC 10136) TaxID=526221 RepID=C9SVB6_VERA1|nr:predicted protein [Verticillium alfalfae VaMs.102]EEY22731.1 predicted protein [Verticillium alfalfae VaMs.102]